MPQVNNRQDLMNYSGPANSKCHLLGDTLGWALEFGPKSRWKRSGRRTGYAAWKSASARKGGAFDGFVKVGTADAKSEKPAGAIWSAQQSLSRVRKRSPVEQVEGEAPAECVRD
jgi:hypothetical protein